MDSQRLTGGVNEVIRIGSVVHRPAGAWTPTVHELLRYVRRRGFSGAPGVHGFDEYGWEKLDFVAGEVPSSEFVASLEGLRAMGALLRSFHDATVGFGSDGPWYSPPVPGRPAEVICHGDVAPYNTVFRDGLPVALIDFDTARPGPRVWDVAYAAYRFVPLRPSSDGSAAESFSSPSALPARLEAFLAGYRMTFPDLFDVAAETLTALCGHMVAQAAAGNAAFAAHINRGDLRIYQESIEFMRTLPQSLLLSPSLTRDQTVTYSRRMTIATQTTQIYQIFIKATPQAVWDALTEPSWNSRYGYGGDGTYELTPGGAYRCIATPEMQAAGMPELVVAGEVIEVDPPWKLVQTWDARWDTDPATTLTYEIAETAPGVCKLTVIHDLAGAPQTAAMVGGGVEGAGGGWAMTLSDLKSLLETGTGMFTPAP